MKLKKVTILMPESMYNLLQEIRGGVIKETKQSISFSAVLLIFVMKGIEGGKGEKANTV